MDLVELTAKLLGVIAEDALEGDGFDGVAERRGGAVRVDVADLLGRDAGVAQRRAHDAVGAIAVLGGLRDVVGVAGHAVADDLGEDARAAALGVLERFHDQDAGAFADDEAVALGVKRAAGALRLVVARGERLHGGKSADAHGRDRGFRAAADHHFGVAALDEAEGIADGVRRSRAGRGRRRIRAARAVANRDHAGRQIDDGRGNEKRGDAARAAFEQLDVLALDDVEPADAGGDVDAGGVGDGRA